jgi:transcriptional regulator with XRE-family HTH domain
LEDQLRQSIRQSGLRLNQLGQRSGLDKGRLARFLRGQRDLTLAATARVAEVFGLHLCLAKCKGDRS